MTHTEDRPGLDPPAPPPRRALLVEPDVVTRRLLEAQLGVMGLVVEVASTTSEAVDKAGGTDLAVVLVACRPGGVGAVEAVQRIRAARSASTPLRCIALWTGQAGADPLTGIDAELVKPVDPDALRRALGPVAAAPAARTQAPTLDTERLEAICRGHDAFQARLLEMFTAEATDARRGVAVAVAAGDEAARRRHAHRLKGSAHNVGATRLAEAAEAVERAAAGDLPQLVARLDAAWELTRAAVARRCEELS